MAYVNIPEKLLKASTKELDKELHLVPGKEKYAKWFLRGDKFYQHVYRSGRISIIKEYEKGHLKREETDDLTYYHIPISKTILANLKIKNIKESVKYWSSERLQKYLFKTACELYPEDRVDTEISEYDGFSTVDITIYYPNLKISNSVELEHTLRDVYVRYRFLLYSDGWKLDNISLTRTSYEIKEIRKGYIFSHTYSSYNPIEWSSNFCYGYTELEKFISNCKSSESNFIDYFSKLLLTFEEYLQWESLEGRPFISITTFSYTTSVDGLSFKPNILFSSKKKEFLQLVLDNVNLQYDFNIVDGEYVINLKQETVESIRELLTASYPDLCYILYNNLSYTRIPDNILNKVKSIHEKDSAVTFKGEIKKMNIVDIDTIDEIRAEDTYSIHVAVLKYVIDTLELKLKNYFIKKQLGWKPKEILVQEPEVMLEEQDILLPWD